MGTVTVSGAGAGTTGAAGATGVAGGVTGAIGALGGAAGAGAAGLIGLKSITGAPPPEPLSPPQACSSPPARVPTITKVNRRRFGF